MADLKTQTDSLASHIDVNQEKAEACHWEMKARQKKMKAAINSIHVKTFS
jgi:hypothetical protein